jgi:serine/threonine protein kinase
LSSSRRDLTYSEDFEDLYIVMEYVETDLAKLLDTGRELSEERLKSIMLQLLAALRYLHR